MKTYIAVVDDEPDILKLVTVNLDKAGYQTRGFTSAGKFLDSLDHERPELVVLDLMLPDQDGFEVCRLLRSNQAWSDIPVIMLTARTQEYDKVRGLEIGADDYITKPFSPKELLARVKAVLRRSGLAASRPIEIGRLAIDPERFTVHSDGVEIKLTAVEFKILLLLSANRGKVFSREMILDHLWGNEKAVLDRTVDVHIKNLRDKLGAAGNMIKNIRSVGYKMDAEA